MVKAIYNGETDMYLTNLGAYNVKDYDARTVLLEVRSDMFITVGRHLCTIFDEKANKATPFKQVINDALACSNWKMEGGIDMNNTDIMSGSPLWQEEGKSIEYIPGHKDDEGDSRYNVPKEKPKFSQEEIDAVIAENEIYRRTRAEMQRNLQREQVGYGMGKYPEPLTADTWTILETLGHIKGEIMDALHYITMLEIKFEKMGDK
jgi:hypothetical protein